MVNFIVYLINFLKSTCAIDLFLLGEFSKVIEIQCFCIICIIFLLSFSLLTYIYASPCQLLLEVELWASNLLWSRSFYLLTYPFVSCLYLYKEMISNKDFGESDSSMWQSLVPAPTPKAMASLFFLHFFNIIWQRSIRFVLHSHNWSNLKNSTFSSKNKIAGEF